ncbi:MAG: metal ABC transporter permease [Patulibacter sp.]
MHWLLDPYASAFMQRALLASLLVGIVVPVVGTWIVLQRLAYMGDAMAHASLGGVATAYVAGASITLGAVGAGIVMAGLMALLAANPRLKGDSIIGIVEVTLFAAGVLIISRSQAVAVDLSHYLFGSITTVTAHDLTINAILGCVVLAASVALWSDLRAMSFDRAGARLAGIRVGLLQTGLLGLLAITVVLALQTVGVLMNIALLIVPAATARLWARTTSQIALLGAAFGVFASVAGLTISYHASAPPGAAIALSCVVLLVISFVLTLPRRARSSR